MEVFMRENWLRACDMELESCSGAMDQNMRDNGNAGMFKELEC